MTEFTSWKSALVKEIEAAAALRAEQALADPADPRIGESQKALFSLAEDLRSMPDNHAKLKALFSEESELSNIRRAAPGEAESRYQEAKEELLHAYGPEHETFASADQFLDVLKAKADETISEYRMN